MTSIGEIIHDWYIQGIQLNPCYMDDWDEIKSCFQRYGLKLNQCGPIITMNELRFVREAVKITELVADTNEYRSLENDHINERNRRAKVFMLHMYTFPYFSRLVSLPLYEKWIETPDDRLKKIYNLDGTLKQKDQQIEEIVRKAILFLRKK